MNSLILWNGFSKTLKRYINNKHIKYANPEKAFNRAWQINKINRINNIHRINNGLISRCKFGLGLIWINNRLIWINN